MAVAQSSPTSDQYVEIPPSILVQTLKGKGKCPLMLNCTQPVAGLLSSVNSMRTW